MKENINSCQEALVVTLFATFLSSPTTTKAIKTENSVLNGTKKKGITSEHQSTESHL